MALKTIGTLATTTLSGMQFTPNMSEADLATFNQDALLPGDLNPAQPAVPFCLNKAGQFTIPGRVGTITLQPNDWVWVDMASGSVGIILRSCMPKTLTASGTTTSTSKNVTFASSVLALGWTIGMPMTGTNIAASSKITAISSDGKTVTLNNAATGSATNTMTVSNFTHS